VKKRVFLFSLLLCVGIQATNDPALNQQPLIPSSQNNIAHLLGSARAIQLAHFRAQFIHQNPNATLQEITERMRQVERMMIAGTAEFLAQQMTHRPYSAPPSSR